MAYKVGYCPQCDTQIMVRDTKGRYNSFMPNWRQVDLFFEDGHRVRTAICDKCIADPDYDVLIAAITHAESTACRSDVKEVLTARGSPISHRQWSISDGN